MSIPGDQHDHGNCELCDALERQLAIAQDTIARLQERVEALDTDLTEIATTMTEHFDMVDLNDLPVSLTKGIKALQARAEEAEAELGHYKRVAQDLVNIGHDRDRYKALAERRKGVLERERDHWRAALVAFKGNDTVDIDYASALRAESELTHLLEGT